MEINTKKPDDKPEIDVAEELVLLTRGFFTLPLLSTFGRLGVLDKMVFKESFCLQDFSNIRNKKLLEFSFGYMGRIGLLVRHEKKGIWSVTDAGKKIFQRASSFYVPHSYREYLHSFYDELTTSETLQKRPVDRLENIVGSGKTHLRYFPYAVSFLKRKVKFDMILDIGCGDGHFLEVVLNSIPLKKAAGIDLSPISTQETAQKLAKKWPQLQTTVICADAGNVQHWSKELLRATEGQQLVISMWFLLHEISKHDSTPIIEFLNQIHHHFPKASLVIGEIVRQESALLSQHSKETLMPEYLFFHDLSGQGVLPWQQYQELLDKIPYTLASERLFDEMTNRQTGHSEPSAFIWHLTPKSHS